MTSPTASPTHLEAVAPPAEITHCPIMSTYGPPAVMFVRGEGSRLYDPTGKEYIDWLAGIAVTSLGHAHPAIADAIATQARTLLHVSNLFATEPQWKVARLLDELIGGPAGQVFFCNSGAEANEAAIKLARRHGGRGRHVVVSGMRSFHGRTLATLHATGQPEKHEAFQPLPEGFRHVAYGDVDALEKGLDDTVAAVLLEPIQGEGGVVEPDPAYFPAVREICTERGILLMFDEVQTGLARTGAWFGHHHHNVEPDVITMAKALGNGMPIGAVWARKDVAAAFKPGDHATTFGGQPLATAAALATLETMMQINAPSLAKTVGAVLREKLLGLTGVTGVRGRGLLLAAELDLDVLGERKAADIAKACLHGGLVLNAVTPTALRIAPPITITVAEIEQGLTVLDSVLHA